MKQRSLQSQFVYQSKLYDSEGKEVKSASGFHDINEVKKELEHVVKHVQPQNDDYQRRLKRK